MGVGENPLLFLFGNDLKIMNYPPAKDRWVSVTTGATS